MPGSAMTGEPASRDRDARGRARNARPRDALGRPLARSATGQLPLVDEPALPPAQALRTAQDLLDAGSPFRAHEVLEAGWKAAPEAERDLWQGLAQIAVGLTHARRGNGRGAAALLRRGADRISGYPAPAPHEIDVDGLRQQCRALADRIDAAGLGGLAAGDVQIRLRVSGPAAAPG
jgi:uncharacterized protein